MRLEPAGEPAREIHTQLSSIADRADPAHAQVAHDLAHHTRQPRVRADQVAALDPTGPRTSDRAGAARGSTVDGGAAGYRMKG